MVTILSFCLPCAVYMQKFSPAPVTTRKQVLFLWHVIRGVCSSICGSVMQKNCPIYFKYKPKFSSTVTLLEVQGSKVKVKDTKMRKSVFG